MSMLPWDEFYIPAEGRASTVSADPSMNQMDQFYLARPSALGVMGGDFSKMKTFAPLLKADLIERSEEYQVHVDLPGVKAEDLELSIHDHNLDMKAERKFVHKVDSDTVHAIERTFGKVQRKIRIPDNADMDLASSSFKDGVLVVSLPKMSAHPSGMRKIPVHFENSPEKDASDTTEK